MTFDWMEFQMILNFKINTVHNKNDLENMSNIKTDSTPREERKMV